MKKIIIRKNYLINKRFQFNHILSMGLMLFLAFVFTAFLSGWFYLYVLDTRLIHNHNNLVVMKMGIVFLFIFIGMVIWSVKYTHSIAGPMYKVCNILKDAAEGVYPENPIRFRKRDLFKRVAENLDLCLFSMKETKDKLNSTLNNIEALKTALKTGIVSTDECEQVLEDILKNAENLNNATTLNNSDEHDNTNEQKAG